MEQATATPLKKTALNARHRASGAKMVPFGGWDMPVESSGLADAHFLLVVNAGNIPKDYAWIAEHIKPAGDVVAVDASSRYALIAVQGPEAQNVLQPLTGVDLASIKYYWFAHGEVANVRATISRTGYTGEDGFEIFVPPQSADKVWSALLESGRAADVIPC